MAESFRFYHRINVMAAIGKVRILRNRAIVAGGGQCADVLLFHDARISDPELDDQERADVHPGEYYGTHYANWIESPPVEALEALLAMATRTGPYSNRATYNALDDHWTDARFQRAVADRCRELLGRPSQGLELVVEFADKSEVSVVPITVGRGEATAGSARAGAVVFTAPESWDPITSDIIQAAIKDRGRVWGDNYRVSGQVELAARGLERLATREFKFELRPTYFVDADGIRLSFWPATATWCDVRRAVSYDCDDSGHPISAAGERIKGRWLQYRFAAPLPGELNPTVLAVGAAKVGLPAGAGVMERAIFLFGHDSNLVTEFATVFEKSTQQI